jgi:hypothetical protein
VEPDILQWVEGYYQNGNAVTTKLICAHALKLALDYNVEDFKVSAAAL